jgi:hypothetical protein
MPLTKMANIFYGHIALSKAMTDSNGDRLLRGREIIEPRSYTMMREKHCKAFQTPAEPCVCQRHLLVHPEIRIASHCDGQ